MIKIVTVIGARPQIIKASALNRALRKQFSERIREVIVHTGQHYDDNMSEVFFRQMEIPAPAYNLNVGSGSHGNQTALMIKGLEEILLKEKPDMLVVYGDTNSTLAGAIAASKIHIPVAHVEAGLRSFNKTMPEEINRIVCDHCSTLLFTPTVTGYQNLLNEGFHADTLPPFTADNPAVFHCGDVMYDNSLYFSSIAEQQSVILEEHGLESGNFILATIHRDNNTDKPERLTALFSAIHHITENYGLTAVLPLHPRTSRLLAGNLEPALYREIMKNTRMKLIPPASFFDMIVLEKNCRMLLTDSGGVQKEAYFFRKPAIILRSETEWKEIVEHHAGIVTDADEKRILQAFEHFYRTEDLAFPEIFGDGKAGEFICNTILKTIEAR